MEGIMKKLLFISAFLFCLLPAWVGAETYLDGVETEVGPAIVNPTITGGTITGITDLAIADGGTGQSTAVAAFGALKQDATTSATGVVELATDAETVTGTATDKAITPATLKAKMSAPGAIGDTTPATTVTSPIVYGSAASGGDLTLEGSSHATNGDVLIQPTDGFTAVGPVTPTTTFAIGGGQTVKKTNVSDAVYGTSALTSDYIVAWSSLTAARVAVISTEDVESGTATQPRVIVLKDESGNAGTYNITITLENGGTIDGAASFVINQPYMSVPIYLNGTNGFVAF
jgi:hypothetical protein